MGALTDLGLRLRIFLFFAFLGLASVIIISAALWLGHQRLESVGTVSAFIQAGSIAGFAILGLTVWIWFLFDTHVARAIEDLSGSMMARAQSDSSKNINADPAKYLGDLAPAALAMTDNLTACRSELGTVIERETAQISQERASLAGILADVPEGVLLCSAVHHIVFYNGAAVDLLAEDAVKPALNRSLFTCLQSGAIQSAYDRLYAGQTGESVELICSTPGEGRVLAARMRLLQQNFTANETGNGNEPGQDALPGYVLTLRDITRNLALQEDRQKLIDNVVARIRRPVGNMQAMVDDFQHGDSEAAFHTNIGAEVAGLAQDIEELGGIIDRHRAAWWPKANHHISDILDGIAGDLAQEGYNLRLTCSSGTVYCDDFQIHMLVLRLLRHLIKDGKALNPGLSFQEQTKSGEDHVMVLDWQGHALSPEILDSWLTAPLKLGPVLSSGHRILQVHDAAITPGESDNDRHRLYLTLPRQKETNSKTQTQKSLAAYDFDLLARNVSQDLMATPLTHLSYVVFDTETTGLRPDAGDELVQIAGLRLVSGKRIEGEEFDQLVQPGRKIPPSSTDVHGITDDMVADAEPVPIVLAKFHHFAEDTVLVAHNAPFDMTFLKRRQQEIGKIWDHPVLDTVLLSAVLFGQSATHTLDALTERLGIVIPPELRHTAMGDTRATAEAFEKMLPMLKARGIATFGDALREVRKHPRLLQDLNDARMDALSTGKIANA